MIPEEDWISRPCDWLRSGEQDGDVVVSTRVRLARNLRGYPMPWRMTKDERIEVESLISEQLNHANVGEELQRIRLDEVGEIQRHLLVERHLISRELAEGDGRRGAYLGHAERLAIMTIEEDHLRLQSLRAGFQVEDAWQQLNTIDSKLEKHLPYAVSEELGYLTSCPTNVGTGMRVSVMLHLPTLAQTKQIDKVANAAAKVGLVLRGYRGEGSEAIGDLHQVSNQVTLGRSEEDIRDDLERMVTKIVEWERGLRRLLLQQSRNEMEDRIWRAFGILRFARRINTEEALTQLSTLRLGVHLDILSSVDLQTLNELFLLTQPAHLQSLLGCDLDADERDQHRATYIRDRLARQ
ncbi:MAG: protein arginine kinase [Planctomycetota bacterium]